MALEQIESSHPASSQPTSAKPTSLHSTSRPTSQHKSEPPAAETTAQPTSELTSSPSRSKNKHVSLETLIKENKQLKVYETQRGVLATYQTKNLEASSPQTWWEIPVEKWKLHADIIVFPEDQVAGKGPVKIASVPISISTAVQRSFLGQRRNIYVTSRV